MNRLFSHGYIQLKGLFPKSMRSLVIMYDKSLCSSILSNFRQTRSVAAYCLTCRMALLTHTGCCATTLGRQLASPRPAFVNSSTFYIYNMTALLFFVQADQLTLHVPFDSSPNRLHAQHT